MGNKKATIVAAASQGIGAAVVRSFPDRGHGVVGETRSLSSETLTLSRKLALVEGDIELATTAEKITQTRIERIGSVCGRVEGLRSPQRSDVLTREVTWAATSLDNKPAMEPSAVECPHSCTGLSCPECEERSYLRVLVAELIYRNQVLRFDLIEARDQVQRIEPVGADR